MYSKQWKCRSLFSSIFAMKAVQVSILAWIDNLSQLLHWQCTMKSAHNVKRRNISLYYLNVADCILLTTLSHCVISRFEIWKVFHPQRSRSHNTECGCIAFFFGRMLNTLFESSLSMTSIPKTVAKDSDYTVISLHYPRLQVFKRLLRCY